MIRNLWWCLFQPVNVRVFYRAGCFDSENNRPTGWSVSQVAFDRCSKREQEFIIWRDPIFKEFQK